MFTSGLKCPFFQSPIGIAKTYRLCGLGGLKNGTLLGEDEMSCGAAGDHGHMDSAVAESLGAGGDGKGRREGGEEC